MNEIRARVRDNTVLGHTRLVPEIGLHLLRADSPLWASFDPKHEQDLPCPRPYWAFAWASGQAIARFLLDEPERARGRRVLDLGAGCGVAALAAALAGATRACANDIDAHASATVSANANHNGVEIESVCGDLLHGAPTDHDLILCADLWYERRLRDHSMRWLTACARAGAEVLVADSGRGYAPLSSCEEVARYACRSEPDVDAPELRQVTLYRIVPTGVRATPG